MSLGVGQLLLGSLMGGLLGNKDEQQQPTQVASNNQSQGGGGFMSNISNSLFKGMSQEQVYRMGQGFNTLRFEPDENLHKSFESRINKLQTTSALTAKTNATVAHLLGMVSDEYPNGRVDLAEMVKNGIMSPTDAINEAIKVKDQSAFAEKMAWLEEHPNASVEEKQLAGITPEKPSAFMEKMTWFKNNPNATDAELAVAGITPATEAVFKQKLAWLEANPNATEEQLAAAGIVVPEKTKLSSFAEKMKWLTDNPNATAEQKQLAGISVPTESTFAEKMKWMADNPNASDAEKIAAGVMQPPSLFMQKMDWLEDNPNATEDQKTIIGIAVTKADFEKKIAWLDANPEASDGALQVLGINDPALYKQQIETLKEDLANGVITQEEFNEGKYKLTTGLAPDDGMSPRYKYLDEIAVEVNGLERGSKEYIDFINKNIDGAAVNVNLNDGENASNAYLKAYIPTYIEESSKIVKDVDTALDQVDKLGGLLDILESADTGKGVAPFTGIFQPLLTQMSRVVTSLGIDRKYASEIEAYKNSTGEAKAKARDILYEKLVKTEITKVMTGSDVFPMISSLGIGARGLDTPAERDFLISVMTGLPNMTLDTLKYMTRFRLQMYMDGLEKYNDKVESGYFKMHNENPNLQKREIIDLAPLYRYTPSGELIDKDTTPTYSQDEIDLIFGNI